MKPLRQVCAVMILSLTLTCSALAGHMDTPAAPAPTPPPAATAAPSADTSMNTTVTTLIVKTILSLIYR
jgi:hypothetical protein